MSKPSPCPLRVGLLALLLTAFATPAMASSPPWPGASEDLRQRITPGSQRFLETRSEWSLHPLAAGMAIGPHRRSDDTGKKEIAQKTAVTFQRTLTVRATRHSLLLDFPESMTPSALAHRIDAALQSLGYRTLYQCEGPDCGKSVYWQLGLNEQVLGPTRNQHYRLAARLPLAQDPDAGHAEHVQLYWNHAGCCVRLLFQALDGPSEANPTQGAEAYPTAAGPPGIIGYFAPSATTLSPAFGQRLEAVVRHAQQHPDWRLHLHAGTDASGSPAINRELKRERLEHLRSELIRRGLSPDRLVAEEAPPQRLSSASDPVQLTKALQRRVEIRWSTGHATTAPRVAVTLPAPVPASPVPP